VFVARLKMGYYYELTNDYEIDKFIRAFVSKNFAIFGSY
jgi:hypothetical protein